MPQDKNKNLTVYRVIYGDTDQMGVAYYANYLRWFEMGRTELLRQLGASYASIEETGVLFPVAEVSCRYFKPARYDDRIVIETTLASLGRASLVFNYRLFREGHEALLATGWTKHACVDRGGRITKIPPNFLKVLSSVLSPKA